jgi:hypothetical protein
MKVGSMKRLILYFESGAISTVLTKSIPCCMKVQPREI